MSITKFQLTETVNESISHLRRSLLDFCDIIIKSSHQQSGQIIQSLRKVIHISFDISNDNLSAQELKEKIIIGTKTILDKCQEIQDNSYKKENIEIEKIKKRIHNDVGELERVLSLITEIINLHDSIPKTPIQPIEEPKKEIKEQPSAVGNPTII